MPSPEYFEGVEAFKEFGPGDDYCPYDDDSQEAYDWWTGWQDAYYKEL